LYGFPGERLEDYDRTASLIPAIWHLDPPTGYGPIRVDRFSPYHADPAAFGMVNLRPMAPFTYLYPFEQKQLQNIAYYFDFDYSNDRTDDAYAHGAIDLVRAWMADGNRGTLVLSRQFGGAIELLDTRGERAAAPERARLQGWKAAVYLACDRGQPLSSLLNLPQVDAEGIGADHLRAFLDRCVEHQLMISSGQSWLNVAVHVPAREHVEIESLDPPTGVVLGRTLTASHDPGPRAL
jgi:hypothetical protein